MLRSFLAASAFAIAAAVNQSVAQSAYGIAIPIRGAAGIDDAAFGVPALDSATGIDLVRGESLSAAAAGAARQAANPVDVHGDSRYRRVEGVSIFEAANGTAGLMAVGSSVYEVSSNLLATRLARKSAYVRAHADALATLMEHVYGADVDRQVAIIQRIGSDATGISAFESEESNFDEAIRSRSSGLVRGAQVWKCVDDGEIVRVWLFTTDESASGNRHASPTAKVATARQYGATIESVMDEIRAGILPPVGSKVVVCDERGEATYLGFGSAVLLDSQAARSAVEKKAEARAKVGLLSALQGLEAEYSSELTGAEMSQGTDLQDFGKALPGSQGDRQTVKGVTASFSRSEEMEEATKLAVQGRLPAGTRSTSFVDDENGWHTVVYMWTVGAHDTLSRTDSGAGHMGSVDGGPQAAYALSGERIANQAVGEEAHLADSNFLQSASQGCDRPAPDGHVRVLTVGEGMNRRTALKAALLEAVERANGSAIKGSTAVRQQYRDAISDLNGQLSASIDSVSSVEEDIYTQANGMVKTYEVVSESNDADSRMVRLEVCALVPIFDASRPRPGRRPTIAIVPLGVGAQEFEMAGRSVPAESVAEEVTAELASGLVKLGSFTVLERQHLEELESELEYLRAGLADGSIEQAEGLKLGHALGADYIVVGELVYLEHKLWKEYIPIRKKEEPRESLAIKSGCRLLNVATGAIVDADEGFSIYSPIN